MNDLLPPEVLNLDSVTIVRPGKDYAHLYENMLSQLAIIPQLAEAVNPPYLVVDLQHVKFIGSAFLGFLVSVHKTVTGRESGRFALCGLSSFCRAAITVSKLEKLLDIFDNADQAAQAIAGTPAV